MTDFYGIPLVSLRENSITELDLGDNGVEVPGAIVLSKLLPSAAALTSLKYASRPKAFAFADRKANTFCAHRLNENRLGPKGGAALAEGIKGNSTLQSLS